MPNNNELQYAFWIDESYKNLLSKITSHHTKFCWQMQMSKEEIEQEVFKNRFEVLAALKKKIDQDLAAITMDDI
jgi:hypothetical protein